MDATVMGKLISTSIVHLLSGGGDMTQEFEVPGDTTFELKSQLHTALRPFSYERVLL